jgi:hypothetical protein
VTKNRDIIALVDRNRLNIVSVTRWPVMGDKYGRVEFWATDANGDVWFASVDGAVAMWGASPKDPAEFKWWKAILPPSPKP